MYLVLGSIILTFCVLFKVPFSANVGVYYIGMVLIADAIYSKKG